MACGQRKKCQENQGKATMHGAKNWTETGVWIYNYFTHL
jgi:hypothetical protein